MFHSTLFLLQYLISPELIHSILNILRALYQYQSQVFHLWLTTIECFTESLLSQVTEDIKWG
jgi:hypothetical protein